MFTPENKLESALVKAATDPASRSQFYRELLEADLLVIGESASNEPLGSRVAAEGERLHVRHMEFEGQVHLPVFSSLARLQANLSEPVGYLALNGRTLMEMTQGTPLVLNPGSDYGKVLTSGEVASLLDGSLWSSTSSYTAERDTQVFLGQPAVYPQELVDVLTRVFKRLKPVRRAYLAHFHNPETGEEPHTLIGLEVNGDWDAVMAEVGVATREVEVPDPPVDFVRVEGGRDAKGVGHYLVNKCEPFYSAKRLGVF